MEQVQHSEKYDILKKTFKKMVVKMLLLKVAICDDIQSELDKIKTALRAYEEIHPEIYFDTDEYHMALLFSTFVCRHSWNRCGRGNVGKGSGYQYYFSDNER